MKCAPVCATSRNPKFDVIVTSSHIRYEYTRCLVLLNVYKERKVNKSTKCLQTTKCLPCLPTEIPSSK